LTHCVSLLDAAVDDQVDIGLTVSLKELYVHDNHNDSFINGNGEIYLITSVIDGSGK